MASGREAEALDFVPRERGGQEGQRGALFYGRKSDGGFELVVDADGDAWLPEWPVCMVDWVGAAAYAKWEATRTGQPWRLPGELEWEKAARGVDGRVYPWGDHLDPCWCCTRHSQPGRPLMAVVDSYPVDESPYGLRGMGGNMREWCGEAFEREGPSLSGRRVRAPAPEALGPSSRVARGGGWNSPVSYHRLGARDGHAPDHRAVALSFRIARPLH